MFDAHENASAKMKFSKLNFFTLFISLLVHLPTHAQTDQAKITKNTFDDHGRLVHAERRNHKVDYTYEGLSDLPVRVVNRYVGSQPILNDDGKQIDSKDSGVEAIITYDPAGNATSYLWRSLSNGSHHELRLRYNGLRKPVYIEEVGVGSIIVKYDEHGTEHAVFDDNDIDAKGVLNIYLGIMSWVTVKPL